MNDKERLDWLEKQDGGALLNNDVGKWAFASDGFQNIETTDDNLFDLRSIWFVEKHAFFTTIREAIDHAISLEQGEK